MLDLKRFYGCTLVFFTIIFLINFLLPADLLNAADEISSDRLKKLKDALDSGAVKAASSAPGSIPGNSGGNQVPNGAGIVKNDSASKSNAPSSLQEAVIPGVSILTIPSSPFGIKIGEPVQFMVSPALNFMAAGVKKAFIEWTVVNKKNGAVMHKSPKININCVNGQLTSAAVTGVLNEFRAPVSGDFEVSFKILYKIFGRSDDLVAVSNKLQFNYNDPAEAIMVGSAGKIVKMGGASGTSSVEFVDAMKVNSNDDKIKEISFFRVEPGDVKERNVYTWRSDTPKIKDIPRAEPKAMHAKVTALIKNGSDSEINKFDHNMNVLDEKDEKYDEIIDGKKVKWSGINIDGGGPIPGSEKHMWTVSMPEIKVDGSVSWTVKEKKESDSDFQYAFPEPCEPFKAAVKLNIKYRQVDFKFKRNQGASNGVKEASVVYRNPLEYVKKMRGNLKDLELKDLALKVSGGDGAGVSGKIGDIDINITIAYRYKVEKKDDQDGSSKGKSNDNAPGIAKNSGSNGPEIKEDNIVFLAKAGEVWAEQQKDLKTTSANAVKYEKVLDTTAPKIELLQDTAMAGLADANSVICTTGDLVFLKVKVTDNNRYSPVRLPYLTYQTGPAVGGNIPLSAVPLKMDAMAGSAPDISAQRPFPGGNVGIYYALAPVPYNIKGKNAAKWFVDVFDGASSPHSHKFLDQPALGNHNQMDLGFDGIGLSMSETERCDRHGNGAGFLDIYDNDRPNITVSMWKVDRAEIFKIGEFSAAEEYFIEDCYYTPGQLPADKSFVGSPGLYRGFIPDGLIKVFNPATYSAAQPFPYFPPLFYQAERKAFVVKSIKNQVDFSDAFKYKAGFGNETPGTCPVVFEDVKYLFTVDVDDNVEYVVNNGLIGPLNKLDKLDIKFAFNDKGSGKTTPAIGAMYDLDFDQKTGLAQTDSPGDLRVMWYLGPEDPAVPMDKNDPEFRKIPTFEHVFHSVSNNNGTASDDYSLKFEVIDKAGHHRKLNIYFQVKEVTNELRTLEEKYRKEPVQNK